MASFYETIKEINETADIVAVIGKYIKLSKQGANYMGVCPFHPDTSPSLCVSPKKHIWKCFVCGAGGKAIDFVQQFKKCTLEEAVKIVAEDTGYDISKIQSNFKGSYLDPKLKRLYDANKQVNE
jgi:DNA primase